MNTIKTRPRGGIIVVQKAPKEGKWYTEHNGTKYNTDS